MQLLMAHGALEHLNPSLPWATWRARCLLAITQSQGDTTLATPVSPIEGSPNRMDFCAYDSSASASPTWLTAFALRDKSDRTSRNSSLSGIGQGS